MYCLCTYIPRREADSPAELTLPEQPWCSETAAFSVLPRSASALYHHSALHVTYASEMTDAAVLILQQGTTLVPKHCHLHKRSLKTEYERAVRQYANNRMVKRDAYEI